MAPEVSRSLSFKADHLCSASRSPRRRRIYCARVLSGRVGCSVSADVSAHYCAPAQAKIMNRCEMYAIYDELCL